MGAALRFFFVQFLFGFGRHVPLVAALAAAAALVFVPDVNKAFGLRHLLWHEDAVKQAAVGFGLGVLIVQTLMAGYLLETQRTPRAERPRLPGFGPAMTYGVGIVGCAAVMMLPVLIAVGGFWEEPLAGWPLAVGFVPAVLLYLVGLNLLHHEEPDSWISRLGEKLFDGLAQIKLLRVPHAEPGDFPMHGIALLAMGFSIVVYAAVGFGPLGLFSPLIGVFALAGIFVAMYGFLEYFLDFVHPMLALVLIGLIYMGGLGRYSQRFPDLASLYSHPTDLTKYDAMAEDRDLLTPEMVDFCGEARGPYARGQKRPLVVVCVSGGGLRSAAWTTAMLHKLERSFASLTDSSGRPAPVDFPCHIRLITGASGGMVGAGYYVADLPDPPPTPFDRGDISQQYEAITEDCLSPLVHAMTYHDLRGIFSPFGHPRDRGQALEAAWNRSLKGALEQSFDRLRPGEMAGWRPSLVFSPMLVEDGRRLLVSNLDLRGVASNDGAILQESDDPQTDPSLPLKRHANRFSFESYEFFRLFPGAEVRRSFRVATAARMSASFPYVSPAPTLPTSPRRRVVDAGYYDNDGVSLAAAWLFGGGNRDWLRRNASKIVLVQIRDGVSEEQRKLKPAPDGSSALSRGLEFLTSPPAALFSARVGSSSFRNDGLLELLSQELIAELQVQPLLAQLNDGEVTILHQAKERETALAITAQVSADPKKMQQFQQALAEKSPADQEQAGKLENYRRMAATAKFSPAERAKFGRAMRGFRLDNRPDLWVDRMLRKADLQAASLGLTPEDAAALRSKFLTRMDAPAAEDLVRRVRLTFDRVAAEPYFVTVDFEYAGDASLSWYLTTDEKQNILNAAEKQEPRIELLKTWWLAASAQDGPVGK